MEEKRKRGRPRKGKAEPKNDVLEFSSIPIEKPMGLPRKNNKEHKTTKIHVKVEDFDDGGLCKDNIDEEEVDEEERGVGNSMSSSKKFGHLFVYGLNSIAVDHSDLHRLIKKLIRAKFCKLGHETWQEGRLNYQKIIAPEQIAVDQYFSLIQSRVHSGKGHEIIEEESFKDFEMTSVVSLALEGLKEVPRTWKNAHAVFVTAMKVLEDMWGGVEGLERRRRGEFKEECRVKQGLILRRRGQLAGVMQNEIQD